MDDQNEFNRRLIEEFRANREKYGKQPDDRPRLLLNTTGARSGTQRTTPMMFVRDGDRLLVIASNAGAPKHPDWYHNLVANPDVSVEIGGEVFDATATVTQGEERERLWRSIVEQYPFFGEHQAKIERQIPVIALTRHAK